MAAEETTPTRRRRAAAIRCSMSGCMGDLDGQGPFCRQHAEERPYPARVAMEVARRTEDARRVGAGEKVDLHGPVVAGMVLYLIEHGRASVDRLALETSVTPAQARRYVEAMHQAGVVRRVTCKRGERWLLDRVAARRAFPDQPWHWAVG